MRIQDFRTSKGVVGMVLLVGSLMGGSYQMQAGTQLVSSSFLAPDVEPPAPKSNIAPNPGLYGMVPGATACQPTSMPDFSSCEEAALQAINNAHKVEGIPAIALPDNYPSLPNDIQQFIIVNEERITHNVPPLTGILRSLNNIAMQGVVNGSDPPIPSSMFAVANWDSSADPLLADYGYMYQDGWGGSAQSTSNIDCTSATAFGCWGHRYNILFNPGTPLSFGSASLSDESASPGSTEVFASVSPSAGDQYTYTWSGYESSLAHGIKTTTTGHGFIHINLSGSLLGTIMPWVKDVSRWSVGLWHRISNTVSRWF